MGPKKEIKKQVIEQPPKQQQPQIPPHELQGYGKFDYQNGSFYQGNWRLFKGIKLKHGKGILTIQTISSNPINKQLYDGQWQQDCMSGQGVYYYPDGAIYKGTWKENKHNGYGVYQFSNGTIYQGEWKDNLFDGSGFFVDTLGKKWEGEFRRGVFQSKRQGQLVKEKGILLKKQEILKEIGLTLQNLLEAITKSDKKTLKDNLTPFFNLNDNAKEYLKEPYSKFDERPPQKWIQFITIIKGGDYKVLSSNAQSSILPSDRILGKQLQGNGQIVEIICSKDDKIYKLGVLGLQGKKWIVVVALEEEKKK